MEPQMISRAGQTVFARLMGSQIWYQPAGSVAVWEDSSEKGQWPLSAFLSRRKLFPSSGLDARHFSSSLCATAAFQAATLVLELGVRLSNSGSGLFMRNCLGLQKFLPLTQSPLVFTARSYGDLSSCHWNPGLGDLVWGWDSSLLRYSS
ncbi:hypothetical protein HJG60_011186 [Phyllostomus discolor]|uniref:Uncharacterized protein n=1 Tax=Phyllostomus discolor TaxID=89673 RepID=A0A834A3L4_9CHIR|nr:hypothetical protein HJG60_011186 [Phyllostomus discolor]